MIVYRVIKYYNMSDTHNIHINLDQNKSGLIPPNNTPTKDTILDSHYDSAKKLESLTEVLEHLAATNQ